MLEQISFFWVFIYSLYKIWYYQISYDIVSYNMNLHYMILLYQTILYHIELYHLIWYRIKLCHVTWYVITCLVINTGFYHMQYSYIYKNPISVSMADTDLKGWYGFCRADMNHYRIPFRTFLIISTSELVRNFRQWFIRHKTLCDLIHALLCLPWI